MLNNWIKKYVDENETTEEAMLEVIKNSLICSKRHHEECTRGEGKESAQVYKDLLELIYNDKIVVKEVI